MLNKFPCTLIFCLLLLLLCQCKEKNGNEFELNYTGTFETRINGTLLKGSVHLSRNESNPDLLGFDLDAFDGSFLRSTTTFTNIPSNIGKQKLFNKRFINSQAVSSFVTFLSDGDVIGDYYEIFENNQPDNYLEITKFDSEKNEVEGSFQISFARDTTFHPSSQSGLADTLYFTEGIFSASISK